MVCGVSMDRTTVMLTVKRKTNLQTSLLCAIGSPLWPRPVIIFP